MDRRIRSLSWASAAVCLVTRLPFVARRLWDHDSVQFALGVEHYDLAAHQPHPPGYPLYIALLKVLALVGVSPGSGMVALTLIASAGGAACMPLLVARLLESPVSEEESVFGSALLAAALFVFNPLLWFYGELPLLYAVEGALTVVLAWAAARMGLGTGAVVWAAVLLALAGGLRPSSLVLLAPMFLFGLWRTWRKGAVKPAGILLAAAVGGGLVLAWALPLFAAAGGYAAWKHINDEHFRTLLPTTSVLYGAGIGALRHNALVIAKWAVQGLFPGAVVLLWWMVRAPSRVREGVGSLANPFVNRLGFVLAWGLPAILFFALFHITKAGYTLVYLPALLVGLVLFVAPFKPSWKSAGAVALIGAALYFVGPSRVAGEPWWQIPWRDEFHASEIRGFESELDSVRAIAGRFSPASTVLVTVELAGGGDGGASGFLYSWHRHLQWYLPAFTVLSLAPEQHLALRMRGHSPFETVGQRIEVPAGTDRLVFVLAAPPDSRFVLPPGEALFRGERFYVWSAPLPADGRLGPFELVP